MKVVKLVRLPRGTSIHAQLALEEVLFRQSSKNYVVVNQGTKPDTIVMGIGRKLDGTPLLLLFRKKFSRSRRKRRRAENEHRSSVTAVHGWWDSVFG